MDGSSLYLAYIFKLSSDSLLWVTGVCIGRHHGTHCLGFSASKKKIALGSRVNGLALTVGDNRSRC